VTDVSGDDNEITGEGDGGNPSVGVADQLTSDFEIGTYLAVVSGRLDVEWKNLKSLQNQPVKPLSNDFAPGHGAFDAKQNFPKSDAGNRLEFERRSGDSADQD
jgi:hypothetical protein